MLRVKRVNRFSIAVEDLGEARALYERVFAAPYSYGDDYQQDAYLAAVMRLGDATFELLAPTSQRSPIARFLEKRGPGLYHITLEVENLDEAVKEAESLGLMVAGRQEYGPRAEYLQWREVYLHPRDVMGVFYALVEITPHPTSAP